jgi:hypothetical protein
MTLRVLIAYSGSSTYVSTTRDYLLALKRHSNLDVSYVHVTHDAALDFDINDFDVIFHSYCARLCYEGYVSQSYRSALQSFRGLKVLSVQDEYEQTNVLKRAIKELGFHVLLTCVPPDSLERVFPRSEFPALRFEKGLTGYMPDHLADACTRTIPLRDRPVHIGYRARKLPPYYGRLGYEKCLIGNRMRAICIERGIPHDISLDDGDRIYGNHWYEFLGSCRAMLGTETGSNLFDWDGSLKATYQQMVAARGGCEVDYEEFLPIIGDREQIVFMGDISPRIFECAVMRTPMILFRGRYSDMIEPDIHYLSLEKDFSNVDHVLDRLGDVAALTAMADRTYARLVTSADFGYRAFAERLGKLFFEELRRREDIQSNFAFRYGIGHSMESYANLETSLRAEYPTPEPYDRATFETRMGFGSIVVYVSEFERLHTTFDEQVFIFVKELNYLSSVLAKTLGLLLPIDPNLHQRLLSFSTEGPTTALESEIQLVQQQNLMHQRRQRLIVEKLRDKRTHNRTSLGKDLYDSAKERVEHLQIEIVQLNERYERIANSLRGLISLSEVLNLIEIVRSGLQQYLTEAARLTSVYEGYRLQGVCGDDPPQQLDITAGTAMRDRIETECANFLACKNSIADTLVRAFENDVSVPEITARSAISLSTSKQINEQWDAFKHWYEDYVRNTQELLRPRAPRAGIQAGVPSVVIRITLKVARRLWRLIPSQLRQKILSVGFPTAQRLLARFSDLGSNQKSLDS